MGFLKKLREKFHKKLEVLSNRPCELIMSTAHKKYFELLYKLKVVESALNVGDKVPEIKVIDCFGNKFDMYEKLKQGPVVLKFFRGTWCAFCSTDLSTLGETYDEIESLGASAVGVSNTLLEDVKKASIEGNFKFPLVPDTQLEIANKFGLTIPLTSEIVGLYKEHYGFDLVKYFGKKDISIILPSTYVIDQNGYIIYTFLEEDFRKRADLEEVTRVLKKAKLDRKKYVEKCEQRECLIRDFIKGLIKKTHRPTTSSSYFLMKKKDKSSESLDMSRSSAEWDKDPFGFTLNHDSFMESFKLYLQKTFCMENLLFYFEVANYQSLFASRTAEENLVHANSIFETFIRIGSDLEVNIDDNTREKIVEDIKQSLITSDLFYVAFKEVYRLMESDSYSKWKRTREYSEVWKNNGSLDFLSPVPTFAAAEAA
jgi:peroxiredoxin